MTIRALLLTQSSGTSRASLVELKESELPPGRITIRTEWSTLNYKDALAITGKGAVVRRWPMVAGIDLAGTIEVSDHSNWPPGTRVAIVGCGLGEVAWGGLATRAKVDPAWLYRLPDTLTTRQAMAVGSAGFTAALAVMKLQKHGVVPKDGEVVVTGAVGGVGSIAVALLAALGYRVTAVTGRPQEASYLAWLGANRVINRMQFAASGKALQSEQWSAAIDNLGSQTLANICAATRRNGAVAACGLAQGSDFPGTVMPFILRGITLYGINSVFIDIAAREAAWSLILEKLDMNKLADMTNEIGLDEVIDYVPRFLAGEVRGRTVVKVCCSP